MHQKDHQFVSLSHNYKVFKNCSNECSYFHPAHFSRIQAYCTMEKINCTALRSLTCRERKSKENTVDRIKKGSPRRIDPEVLVDTEFNPRPELVSDFLSTSRAFLLVFFFFFLLFAFRFPMLYFLPIKQRTNVNSH